MSFSLREKVAVLPGEVSQDADFAPVMVRLPAGAFTMGERKGDKFANDTERPAHRVEIAPGLALGRFAVTVGEYRAFQAGHAPEDAPELPAVEVSWNDAQAYCAWLTQSVGRGYRLPSEAEWEYACRAGSEQPFSCGHELTTDDANFLYDESGNRIGRGRRIAAGTYRANAFGLHEMHGNVCEWVEDAWHPDYFGAPTDGSARASANGGARVIRGGAWDYLPRLLRSAWRDWLPADHRRDNLGFRVAAQI